MKTGKINRGYNLEPETIARLQQIAELDGVTLGEVVDRTVAQYMRDGLPIFAQIGGSDQLWVVLKQALIKPFTGTVLIEYLAPNGKARLTFLVYVTAATEDQIIQAIYEKIPHYTEAVNALRVAEPCNNQIAKQS